MCDLSEKSSNAREPSVPEKMETFAEDFTVSSSCHVEDIPLDLSLISEEESEHRGEINDAVESGAEDDLQNLDGMVNFRISDILPTGMTPLDNCVIDGDELVVEPSVVSTEYGSSKKSEDFGMFFPRFLLRWKGFVKCDQSRTYRIEHLGYRNMQEMQWHPGKDLRTIHRLRCLSV